jgi:hypothetical protein
MTNQTPEQAAAEREELDDALEEAIYAWHDDRNDAGILPDVIAPALATIRRHAAADALKQQADRHSRIARGFMGQAAIVEPGIARASLIVNAKQTQACARRLRDAADDLIAEGWEHACAAETHGATRIDQASYCEEPVENEGDYCPRHEPADDHDPRDDQ